MRLYSDRLQRIAWQRRIRQARILAPTTLVVLALAGPATATPLMKLSSTVGFSMPEASFVALTTSQVSQADCPKKQDELEKKEKEQKDEEATLKTVQDMLAANKAEILSLSNEIADLTKEVAPNPSRQHEDDEKIHYDRQRIMVLFRADGVLQAKEGSLNDIIGGLEDQETLLRVEIATKKCPPHKKPKEGHS
jgi:septal ring factor EnvC (AmiA/AmiB activator)